MQTRIINLKCLCDCFEHCTKFKINKLNNNFNKIKQIINKPNKAFYKIKDVYIKFIKLNF